MKWKITAALFTASLWSAATSSPTNSSTGSLLLRGGTIITFDEASQQLLPFVGDLLVRDGTIAAIEKSIRPSRGVEVIDASDLIISPGFVDTHRHGWQTLYRTLGPNIELPSYYHSFGQFGPAPFIMEPEDVYVSQLAGLYDAINSGVTTIVEHAHHTWTKEHAEAGWRASVDSGARIVWCYAVQPTWRSENNLTLNTDFEWQLKQMVELSEKSEGSRTKVGLAWDFTNKDDPEGTKRVIKVATDNDLSLVTLHYHGGFFDAFLKKISLWNSWGLLNISTPIIFSHATEMTPAEADILRATNKHISVTTESELLYGMHSNITHTVLDQAGLGVDTHLTFSTDMITQMRITLETVRSTLYNQPKQLAEHNPMTVNQSLYLGTRSGALAIDRPELGAIKVGAKADLVAIDTMTPGLIGTHDPIAATVLHANVGDIKHVIIDGVFKKRDGKLVGGEWEDVKKRFLKSAKRVQKKFLSTDWRKFEQALVDALTHFTPDDYLPVEEADVIRGPGNGWGLLTLFRPLEQD